MRIQDISTTSASLQASSLKSAQWGASQAPAKPAAQNADTVQISGAAKEAAAQAATQPQEDNTSQGAEKLLK